MNSLKLILKNFVNNEPYLQQNEIISFSFNTKPSGEKIGIVTTTLGETYIKTITPEGLDITSIIKIPLFNSLKTRNEFIKSLYPKYNQVEISLFLNMSQSQVSNILRNKSWYYGRYKINWYLKARNS